MNLFTMKLLIAGVGLITVWSFQPDRLDDRDLAKANRMADTVTTSEWLGPLAPIAISPFFGITCLAGMSQIADGTFLENNQFISSNPVLRNPYVFWIFLALTLITSLPRLTKVSKTFAQALDQVETYAGIITVLIIRIAASSMYGTSPETEEVLHMGVLSLTMETLLCVAAVFNIIVINTIKFFLEVLAWLTPVPSIDALLEATNKSVCGCLLAIYAYSPVAATVINLLLFFACLVVFRWVHRRVVYARHIFLDPILTLLIPRYGMPAESHIQVFNQGDWGPFAAKTKLLFEATEEGWQITQRRFLRPNRSIFLDRSVQIELVPGFLTNRIILPAVDTGGLVFTQRYMRHLDEIAKRMNLIRRDNPDEGVSPGLSSI